MPFLQSLFGGSSPAQQSAPATEAPATEAPAQQQSSQAAPANGEGSQAAPNSGEPTTQENVSPLDAYKDLWNNEPTGKEGEATTKDPLSDPSALFNIDPQSIQEAVGRINFAESVKPEHMQAITEGGEGAQQAFMESMNAVARQVFSQSMVGSAKLVEQALSRAGQSIDSRIDGRLRTSQASDAVAEANPAFNHPAAKPMVEALQKQLAAKHPTASPKEISDMAKSYFNDFASSITAPERQQKEQEQAAGQMDWDAWINADS